MDISNRLSKRFIVIFFCFSLLLFIGSIIILLLNTRKNNISTEELYSNSLNYVIEIKASTSDIGESFGTGVIIDNDGLIVTNAHIILYYTHNSYVSFNEIQIRFAFEDNYRKAEIIKYDIGLDLAVLKLLDLPDFELETIKFGDSDKLKSGNRVYAIGNASNYSIGIFEGIVSLPLVNIELDGLMRNVIQCDLTVAAGNSGGALINESGEFVGITTFRTKDISGNVIYGIVYCIPVNIVKQYVNK